MVIRQKILIITIILFSAFTVGKSVSAAITIRPMLNTGLVGYWGMNEGAGTTVYDQSGYRNHGTAYSSTTPSASWADGKIGEAISLDGADDYINAGDPESLDMGLSDMTISAWIYPSSSGTFDDQVINKKLLFAAGYDLKYEHTASSVTARIGDGNITLVTPNNSVPKNQWSQVVVVFDRDDLMKIFINGNNSTSTSISSISGTSQSNAVPFSVGCRNGGAPDKQFNGKIDEVRIYNRVLSAAEITRLYNLTRPKFKAASSLGLVGYWPLDEGQGAIAGDMSGRGYNGTFSGSPVWVDGKKGKALNFPNTENNDWIDLGTSFNISSVPFTISAWINPTDFNNYNTILGKRDGWAANNMRFQLQLNSSTGEVRCDGSPENQHAFGSYSPPLNTWTLLTVVADASYTDLYVNGIFQEGLSGFTLGTDSVAQTAIGRNGEPSDPDAFRGSIDEVRVYNRALGSTEIANLYSSSKKIFKVSASQNNKLTDGLVGMWSFNGPDISGNTAFDRSGSGYNGTITGATIDIGKIGQALSFDGSSNQNVNVGTSSFVCATGSPMTISAWIYPHTSGENSGGRILSRRLNADAYDCTLQFSGDQFQFAWSGATSLFRRTTAASVSFNTWQHILVTWDGSLTGANIHIYRDGAELSYATTSNGADLYYTPGQASLIGKRASNDRDFDGKIDEVRVYNRVLSTAEIKRLYQMGK